MTIEIKAYNLRVFAWVLAGLFGVSAAVTGQEESPPAFGDREAGSEQPGAEARPDPQPVPDQAENEADSEEGDSIVDVIGETEGLERFSEILEQSGYAERFEEELSQLQHSESTVVAPHNDAFDELSDEVLEEMTDPQHRLEVAQIVDAHLFPQKRSVAEMKDAPALFNYRAKNVSASEAEDAELVLSTEDTEVRIIEADLEASDGYVHIADDFLVASIDASTFEGTGMAPEIPGNEEREGGSPDRRPQDDGDGASPW